MLSREVKRFSCGRRSSARGYCHAAMVWRAGQGRVKPLDPEPAEHSANEGLVHFTNNHRVGLREGVERAVTERHGVAVLRVRLISDLLQDLGCGAYRVSASARRT